MIKTLGLFLCCHMAANAVQLTPQECYNGSRHVIVAQEARDAGKPLEEMIALVHAGDYATRPELRELDLEIVAGVYARELTPDTWIKTCLERKGRFEVKTRT